MKSAVLLAALLVVGCERPDPREEDIKVCSVHPKGEERDKCIFKRAEERVHKARSNAVDIVTIS